MAQIRVFLYGCLILVGLWLVLCSGAGVLAVEQTLHPHRRGLDRADESRAASAAKQFGASLTPVAITAADGVPLQAWNLRPTDWNGDAVILLHGHTDNRMGMLGNAELLLRHGYAVLMPDARAHGASGGALATYGVEETDDIQKWVHWLRVSESPRCIDGLGDSMGAAQLLQSLGSESGFCAVVAESPFADFREASYDRLGEKIHAGAWAGRTLLRPIVETGLMYAHWKYGIDLSQSSPESAVRKSHVPVLLIHGLKDTNLPSRNSEMIAEHNRERAPSVEVWEPREAGHCGASGAEPGEYERRVIGWLDSHGTRVPN
jgi:dipeptidyl aminopeptidase/acylaminoacyl peptidase